MSKQPGYGLGIGETVYADPPAQPATDAGSGGISGIDVEDDGAPVGTFVTLDFGVGLAVTDNLDGSATIDATATGVFPNSAGPTAGQWIYAYDDATGNFSLSSIDYSDLTGTPTIPADLSALTFVVRTASGLLSDEYVLTDDKVTWTWAGGTVKGSVAVFVGSGASHATGLVPDPGASAGTLRFLNEDATFRAVSASGDTWTYSVKSANFNAAKDFIYFVDTNGVTATLPGSPTAGDRIRFILAANVSGFTIGRNGNEIMDSSNDVTFPTYIIPFGSEWVYTGANGWALIGA